MAITKATYSMIHGAPVNVLDFGAIGDGVTDDTLAIQTAVDSIGDNASVFFPAGVYNITARVQIQDLNNIAVLGPGAKILATVQPAQIEFTNISGLSIEGVTFDCNNFVTGACVVLNSENVRVFNCQFLNSGDGGGVAGSGYGFVHNTNSSDAGTKRSGLLVDCCVFDTITRDALQTKSVDDVVITSCVFRNIDQTGTDNHAYDGTVVAGERISVTNCTFENCATSGTTAAISVFNKYAVIDGNVITNGQSGVLFGAMDGIISNNRFESMTTDCVQTINQGTLQELLISGNYFELSGGDRMITLFDNPGTYGPLYVTIANNLIEGTGSEAIHFRRDGGLLRIMDNYRSDGYINVVVDGSSKPKIQLRDEIYIEVADNAVSSEVAVFTGAGGSGDFGGVIVGIEDVTDFDLDFFGSAAYSQINTTVVRTAYATNGAKILFRDYQPSTLSAGNVQIGSNVSGVFKIRNDSGVTKTFKVSFVR